MSYTTNPISNRLKLSRGWPIGDFANNDVIRSSKNIVWFKTYLVFKNFFKLLHWHLIEIQQTKSKTKDIIFIKAIRFKKKKAGYHRPIWGNGLVFYKVWNLAKAFRFKKRSESLKPYFTKKKKLFEKSLEKQKPVFGQTLKSLSSTNLNFRKQNKTEQTKNYFLFYKKQLLEKTKQPAILSKLTNIKNKVYNANRFSEIGYGFYDLERREWEKLILLRFKWKEYKYSFKNLVQQKYLFNTQLKKTKATFKSQKKNNLKKNKFSKNEKKSQIIFKIKLKLLKNKKKLRIISKIKLKFLKRKKIKSFIETKKWLRLKKFLWSKNWWPIKKFAIFWNNQQNFNTMPKKILKKKLEFLKINEFIRFKKLVINKKKLFRVKKKFKFLIFNFGIWRNKNSKKTNNINDFVNSTWFSQKSKKKKKFWQVQKLKKIQPKLKIWRCIKNVRFIFSKFEKVSWLKYFRDCKKLNRKKFLTVAPITSISMSFRKIRKLQKKNIFFKILKHKYAIPLKKSAVKNKIKLALNLEQVYLKACHHEREFLLQLKMLSAVHSANNLFIDWKKAMAKKKNFAKEFFDKNKYNLSWESVASRKKVFLTKLNKKTIFNAFRWNFFFKKFLCNALKQDVVVKFRQTNRILISSKYPRFRANKNRALYRYKKQKMFLKLVPLFALLTQWWDPQALTDQIAFELTKIKDHWKFLKSVRGLVKKLKPRYLAGYRIAIRGKIAASKRTRVFHIKTGQMPLKTFAKKMLFCTAQSDARTGSFSIKTWFYYR